MDREDDNLTGEEALLALQITFRAKPELKRDYSILDFSSSDDRKRMVEHNVAPKMTFHCSTEHTLGCLGVGEPKIFDRYLLAIICGNVCCFNK